MKDKNAIRFWNRYTGKEEEELIYGEGWMRFLYETALGKGLAQALSSSTVSRLSGIYQNSWLSRRTIPRFIKDFHIPMEEYESGPFPSFNQFFIRRFVPGSRTFTDKPQCLPAFAEGRYLAFESVSKDQIFPMKGNFLSAAALLGKSDTDLQKKFEGGPLIIARLCPVDYHRFHFPDDGRYLTNYSVHGRLHSVNPIALHFKGDIFATNERQISLLETKNFGLLGYIEVGALCVGKIIQTHDPQIPFRRGDEKGYFLFGASTVILMGEKGRWLPDEDLLRKTSRGMETFIRLGDSIASAGPG